MEMNKYLQLTHDEIADQAAPATSQCGVYFLLRGKTVVYVGQSLAFGGRLRTHLRDGSKSFDSFYFLSVPPELLDVVESYYVHQLQPEHNFKDWGRGKRWMAPLNLDELEKVLLGVTAPCVAPWRDGRSAKANLLPV